MTPRLRRNMPWGKAVRACRHDGFRDVHIYNRDWGTNLLLPVAQGNAPYDEVFGL